MAIGIIVINYMFIGLELQNLKWGWYGQVVYYLASHIGFYPVRGKLLFIWVRNFTLITQYCLFPGMDLRLCLLAKSFLYTIEQK